jgi:hypothetical protein
MNERNELGIKHLTPGLAEGFGNNGTFCVFFSKKPGRFLLPKIIFLSKKPGRSLK